MQLSEGAEARLPPGAWLLRLLAPRAGWREFERLYRYFRWADDVVDAPGRDPAAVRRFLDTQRALLAGEREAEAPPERALAAALARDPAVREVALPMLEALAFDASRPPGPTDATLVRAQAARVGDAYLLALWRCFGAAGAPPPDLAMLARAACLMHLLRDRHIDRALGYENRPPLPSGEPQADEDWVRELSAEAAAGFARGRACLPAVRGWRLRLVLALQAWRYARIDPSRPRA